MPGRVLVVCSCFRKGRLMKSEIHHQHAALRRKRALKSPLVLDPNAKILELFQSIASWVSYTGYALFATALFSIFFASLVFVGLWRDGVAGDGTVGALVIITAGVLQLVLSQLMANYVRSVKRYLNSGNQLRLVEVFFRHRLLCKIIGVVTFSLLALFVIAFAVFFFHLIF